VGLIVGAKLANVRKLGIWFASDESNKEVVLKSLIHLPHLQTLKIIIFQSVLVFRFHFHRNITKITLREVCLDDSGFMKVLGELPDLLIMKLQSICLLSSNYLEVIEGSFPRLEVMKLENLEIKEWKQGKEAMSCLKHLVIKGCIELTVLPSELCSLHALCDVDVLRSSIESVITLQEFTEESWVQSTVIDPLPGDPFSVAPKCTFSFLFFFSFLNKIVTIMLIKLSINCSCFVLSALMMII
jgi:hypothetical protein